MIGDSVTIIQYLCHLSGVQWRHWSIAQSVCVGGKPL